MANNYVYFIQNKDTGLIKIGQSHNPSERILSIRQDAGYALKIMATIPDHSLERELHERFSSLRKEGEWFEPGEELLEYIEANKGRPDLGHLPEEVVRENALLRQMITEYEDIVDEQKELINKFSGFNSELRGRGRIGWIVAIAIFLFNVIGGLWAMFLAPR